MINECYFDQWAKQRYSIRENMEQAVSCFTSEMCEMLAVIFTSWIVFLGGTFGFQSDLISSDRCLSFPELQAQIEAQKATQEFQRSVEILRAAKETIALAEERLLEEDTRQFDSAWQEMLNHATQRVSI